MPEDPKKKKPKKKKKVKPSEQPGSRLDPDRLEELRRRLQQKYH